MAALHPCYPAHALSGLDGRTRASRLLKATRLDLIGHVGGRPTATQSALIERAAQLTLRLAMADAAMVATGDKTECDSQNYLGCTNALERTLRQLGPAAENAPRKSPALQPEKETIDVGT